MLPQDLRSLAIPAITRHVGFGDDPFPLTPALSPRRGGPAARVKAKSQDLDSPRDGIRFSLSPRERAGVRGKLTSALRMGCDLGSMSGYCLSTARQEHYCVDATVGSALGTTVEKLSATMPGATGAAFWSCSRSETEITQFAGRMVLA